MPNPRYRQSDPMNDRGKPPKMAPGHRPDATPERTASWPGLPGNTQPKSRDRAGTRKVKRAAKSEGL